MPPHADVLQWEHLPFPKSLRDFQRLFKDDAAWRAGHFDSYAIDMAITQGRAALTQAPDDGG